MEFNIELEKGIAQPMARRREESRIFQYLT